MSDRAAILKRVLALTEEHPAAFGSWSNLDRAADLACKVMNLVLDAAPDGIELVVVGWRYRYGIGGTWKYVDTEEQCNRLHSYHREPVYGRAP